MFCTANRKPEFIKLKKGHFMLNHIESILEEARSTKRGVIAVAAAHDEDVLKAVSAAHEAGMVNAILVGHADEISSILVSLGKSPADFTIRQAEGDLDCAAAAVKAVHDGEADFLMKGLLGTADLMRAVIDKEKGIRTNRLISHVMLYETDSYPKMLALTDGGMNTFPDLEKKADILENAALVLKALGYEQINAACVCGAEQVNPKIQSTVDARDLSEMNDRWAPYNMSVFGPVGLDLAISPEACRHKRYTAAGGGNADILLVPTYEVGNGIGKAMTYFSAARSAGIIVGARVPIVLVSRADPAEAKLASIALGKLVAANIG